MADNTYVYSDMDRNLSIGNDGNVKVIYDEDVINQSIKTILATITGERIRNPIGSRLIELLFEPMDRITENEIVDEIAATIARYEPRVTIINIELNGVPDQNYYEFNLIYRISGLLGRYNFETKIKTFGG